MMKPLEERDYSLWLYRRAGGDLKAYTKLLNRYESAEEAFSSLGGNQQELFDYIGGLEKKGIRFLHVEDEAYPELLKAIYDPPAILFLKGKLPDREHMPLPIAVIGSRKCTVYGQSMAERFSRDLAQNGLTVVSGLAYGIDGIASRAALEAKTALPTVAVLGSGVDVVYPKANQTLYEKVAERGCVLSEYLPGTDPQKHYFPARNRIISGMSRGVLVVEAGEKSGTAITVGFALDEGRDVFAIPGRVSDPMSMGCNLAIRDGYAKPVLSAEDILMEYGLAEGSSKEEVFDPDRLDEAQRLLYQILLAGERSYDELAEMTKFPPAILNSNLTAMELSGIIKQSPGRMYQLY